MCASQGPECLPARQSAQGQGDGGREEGGVASSLVRNVNGSRQLHSEHTPRQPTAMAMDSSASAVTVSLTRGLPNDATRRHGTGTRPRRPTPRRVHSPPTTPTAAAAAAAKTRARRQTKQHGRSAGRVSHSRPDSLGRRRSRLHAGEPGRPSEREVKWRRRRGPGSGRVVARRADHCFLGGGAHTRRTCAVRCRLPAPGPRACPCSGPGPGPPGFECATS